jgi:hypothetical protein
MALRLSLWPCRRVAFVNLRQSASAQVLSSVDKNLHHALSELAPSKLLPGAKKFSFRFVQADAFVNVLGSGIKRLTA